MFNEDARKKLLSGVEQIAKAVKVTSERKQAQTSQKIRKSEKRKKQLEMFIKRRLNNMKRIAVITGASSGFGSLLTTKLDKEFCAKYLEIVDGEIVVRYENPYTSTADDGTMQEKRFSVDNEI